MTLQRLHPLQSIKGLCQPFGSKFLPSLLLWDTKEQSLYDDILATKHYYLYRVENDLLKDRIYEIANKIASTGIEMLLELGAGNMQKSTLFLSVLDALEIPLTYYALDVDLADLESFLTELRARTNLRNIKLRGLLGTYEDGANWLSSAQRVRNKRRTIVWFGNSIAKFTPYEVSELLGSFTKDQGGQTLSGFILGVDGCRDESMIEYAYDTPGGQSSRWLKHILEGARNHIGQEATEVLDDDNWRMEGRWNVENLRYENYLCAARSMTLSIGIIQVSIQYRECVDILGSGKWLKSDVGRICPKQNLYIAEWWKSAEVDYGIYWLQPTPA